MNKDLIKLKLKDTIKLKLKKYPNQFRYIQYIYTFLTEKERLMHKKSYGNLNSDKTILLIRPNTEDGIQGLMSLFIQTMRWIDYAKRKKYIPYIDFQNYKTQYYDAEHNVWDYFFTQPSSLSLEEVYKSKNVLISGNSWRESVNISLCRDKIFTDQDFCKKCCDLIWDNIDLSSEVKKILEYENNNLKVENCIGVYLRGTDYVKLKPAGEYVQPDITDVMEKIDEFIEKYDKDIFLVTEDNSYYQKLLDRYGKRIKIVSFDKFIKDYNVNTFLSKSGMLDVDKKKRGMDYFVKIILLSRCRYLISSITTGSLSAYCFNGGKYEDKYIFNLGYYK